MDVWHMEVSGGPSNATDIHTVGDTIKTLRMDVLNLIRVLRNHLDLFVKLTGDIVPKILFLLIWGGMIFGISLFTLVDEKTKLSVRPLSRRRHVYIGERTP